MLYIYESLALYIYESLASDWIKRVLSSRVWSSASADTQRQRTVEMCSVLWCIAVYGIVLQRVAVCCVCCGWASGPSRVR